MRSSMETEDSFEDPLEAGDMEKSAFHDAGSEMTSPTEAGSVSEEENPGGWWADFRTIASSLKTTAGGVASFVHRSAAAVAAELAQLEQDRDLEENYGDGAGDSDELHLPWEIKIDGEYAEDRELKEKIFALSTKEETFLRPFAVRGSDDVDEEQQGFVLDEGRILLIRRLLELDDNLAAMHARLSGRSDIRETVFWRNYFHHCVETRKDHLQKYGDSASQGSQNSLVPADKSVEEEEEEEEEDGSFICVPSPPVSMESTGIQSVDSMVVIDGTPQKS